MNNSPQGLLTLKHSTVSHSLHQQILPSVLSRDLRVFSHVTTSELQYFNVSRP